MAAPLVSAILPFADSRRLGLARKVVNQFIRQHYTPYQLVIVNGTDDAVLNNDDMETDAMQASGCHVLEMHVVSGLNAATMKNYGLRAAKGEWAICLDDDDHFHLHRLLYQMAHRRDGQVCLLKYQLRIDVSPALAADSQFDTATYQPLLHLLQEDEGIPGTMLFPLLAPDGLAWQFNEQLNVGEYEELLVRMTQCGLSRVVCDNQHNAFLPEHSLPLLSIAMYHGENELTREQFFPRGQLSERGQVPIGLNGYDMDYLKVVLRSYNFKIL